MSKRPMIAGNWKMNGLQAARAQARAVNAELNGAAATVDVAVCPPFTLIADVARDLGDSAILVGGQDCHGAQTGAFTGCISAEMLSDAGAQVVIIGHSERRAMGETDADIAAKTAAANRAGLLPILCVGEEWAVREAGEAEQVVRAQLMASLPGVETLSEETRARICIAYEPIWAIGSGRTPTPDDIARMHAALGDALNGAGLPDSRLLYGGSVKPANAAEILAVPGVDGVLVGGACLAAESFTAIIQSAL